MNNILNYIRNYVVEHLTDIDTYDIVMRDADGNDVFTGKVTVDRSTSIIQSYYDSKNPGVNILLPADTFSMQTNSLDGLRDSGSAAEIGVSDMSWSNISLSDRGYTLRFSNKTLTVINQETSETNELIPNGDVIITLVLPSVLPSLIPPSVSPTIPLPISTGTQNSCAFLCPGDSSFTMSFNFTTEDALGMGYSKNNTTIKKAGSVQGDVPMMYQSILSGRFITSSDPKFTLPGIIPSGTTIIIPANTTTKNSTYTTSCDLSFQSYDWLYIALLMRRFGINPLRICTAQIIPKPNATNPTHLRFIFTLGPTVASSDKVLFPFDYANAECIKDGVLSWVNQYDPNKIENGINPTDIEPWIEKSGKQIFNRCLDGFTSKPYNEVEYIEDIHIKSIGNISDIKVENYTSNDTIEHITGFTSTRGSTTPTSLLDYIFMYSVPVAFVGAMGYAILSVIQTDVSSMMINKNIVMFTNVYFALCGLFSFCAWFNIDITNVRIGDVNVNKWFSLAVVKLDSNA
jgi:hypothetical protein